MFAFVSAPIDTPLPALARKRTRPFPIPIHAITLPSIVRRMGRGHVLPSDGWVACAPLQRPSHPPLRPPRRSLQENFLNDQAKQAVRDAAGRRVLLEL